MSVHLCASRLLPWWLPLPLGSVLVLLHPRVCTDGPGNRPGPSCRTKHLNLCGVQPQHPQPPRLRVPVAAADCRGATVDLGPPAARWEEGPAEAATHPVTTRGLHGRPVGRCLEVGALQRATRRANGAAAIGPAGVGRQRPVRGVLAAPTRMVVAAAAVVVEVTQAAVVAVVVVAVVVVVVVFGRAVRARCVRELPVQVWAPWVP